MPVAFEQIPENTLLPLFYAEVTSAYQPVAATLRMCLIGHMNKDVAYGEGTAVANVPYFLSGTIATTLFGRGSQLESMYRRARENAPFAEIWAVALPEVVDTVEPPVTVTRGIARVTIVKAPSATAYGLMSFYIGGRGVQCGVLATDTIAALQARLITAINNGNHYVKATAGVPAGEIVLTCRWAGVTGNATDIPLSTYGPNGRRTFSDPPFVLARKLLTMTQMTAGAGESYPNTVFPTIVDRPFDVFVEPYGKSLGTYSMFKDFMDGVGGRWSPFRQGYGHVVTCMKGQFSDTLAVLSTMQDPHMTVLAVLNSALPSWDWASALAAIMTQHWANPPEISRPLQTLQLRGITVGTDDDETFDKLERQALLEAGASTFHVDADGTVRIDRVRTLRKTNAFGDPDVSWADAITMFQAMYFVRSMRAYITSSFPRCALSNFPVGINGFTSPIEIKQAIIHNYKRLEGVGLVENSQLFSQYLVVERNEFDVNRVDVLMRPDFINQLRVVAVLVETHLELNAEDILIAA